MAFATEVLDEIPGDSRGPGLGLPSPPQSPPGVMRCRKSAVSGRRFPRTGLQRKSRSKPQWAVCEELERTIPRRCIAAHESFL